MMNVNKISKIFVEQDEEIVFVIENILNATSDRVILVLPNVSALTSSVVSLRILSKQIVKSIKQLVLVCDNTNARHLCSKSDLAVRSKISEVNKEAWAEAKELKTKLLDENDKIKKELLSARTPDDHEPEISEGVVSAQIVEGEPEKAEEEVKPILEKPRMKGKVIDINGIKLFSGADITDAPDLLDIERRRLNNEDFSEEEEENAERVAEGDLIGTDINAVYSKKDKFKIKAPKIKMPNFLKSLSSSGLGKKLIIGGILLFLAYAVFAYFVTSDVAFTVFQQQSTVQIMKTITADSSAQQIDPAKLTITAEILTKSGTTTGSGEPTGTGKSGNSATGEVDIYNASTTAYNLPVGTVLTEQKTGKGLRFLTTAVITVPAEGSISVAVKAETYGEAYNIAGDSSTYYKIGVYSLSDIYGKNLLGFTGGTTKDVIVVSQDDIDALKATLSDQLKGDLLTQLKSLLADDDILLVGSEKYTEDSFTTTAKAGDQLGAPTDGVTAKFDAELKMTLNALVISKANLRTIAEAVVKAENGTDNQDIAVTLSDPIMEDVQINGTKATFNLRATAKVIGVLDPDKLKTLILGKSVDDAKVILSSFKGVTEVRARYNPPFIPYSVQTVSEDPARVSITLTGSN